MAAGERELVRLITERVLEVLGQPPVEQERTVPVGISARHVHLSKEDAALLFGPDHQLRPRNELYQKGQYAAEESVTLVGPRNVIRQVRVLLPFRKLTQVEVSRTDSISLGVLAPVSLDAGPGKGTRIFLAGPAGVLDRPDALICAHRHIHISPEEARAYKVEDGQRVKARLSGNRALILENVIVRVSPAFRVQLHLDTDEANAADVTCGVGATLID